MAVLVTGGTGYIGSAAVEILRAGGEQVVVLDDLFRGHREALPLGVVLHEGKVGDRELVRQLLKTYDIEACVHFAALTYVGESVEGPLHYYENNTAQSLALLDELVCGGVRRVGISVCSNKFYCLGWGALLFRCLGVAAWGGGRQRRRQRLERRS